MEEEKPPLVEAPKPPPKRTGLWIGIAVVVVVAAILGALAYAGYFTPPTTDESRVLRLGSVLTLTGTSGLEVFGPANQRGVQLAVKEINAAGGVLGNAIVYTPEDDTGVTATARDRAQKLVTTDRVDAIIGAVGSGFCATVLEVTRPNRIVQMSASCTSPIFSNLTYTEGWFFRTAPSDALQGVVAANYAYTERVLRTMAVIGNDNPYGRGLANVFATEFESLGGTAPVSIFALGQASYASDLQVLFTPPLPEAVYMANYPTDGLKVMQDWAANPAWASVEWIFSEGLLDDAGFVDLLDEQGIGLATMQTFEGSAPGAYLGVLPGDYAAFQVRYAAEYPSTPDPGLFTANAYDGVYLIAAAAQAAGAATPDGIKAQLRAVSSSQTGDTVVQANQWATIRTELAAGRGINYEGASGRVDLDQYGDPFSSYGIWGINSLQNIYTIRNYTEAEVLAMLAPPAPAASVVAWSVPLWASPARREA